jgi:hypothetical protein
VEVRETKDRVEIHDGLRRVISHDRLVGKSGQRVMLKEHFRKRGQQAPRRTPSTEEAAITEAMPEAGAYVSALRKRGRQHVTLALRKLLRIVREYPKDAVAAALTEAGHYGLFDLERVERMVLRRVAHDYFPPDIEGDDDE